MIKLTQITAVVLALVSCVPVWAALRALESGDHLGGVLGLLLAWVLARAAVELTAALPGGRLGTGDHPSQPGASGPPETRG